eukprot:IDg6297t1
MRASCPRASSLPRASFRALPSPFPLSIACVSTCQRCVLAALCTPRKSR